MTSRTWAVLLTLTLIASPGPALSAGPVARLYWLEVGKISQSSHSARADSVRILVSLQGVKSLRGLDVQLLVRPTTGDSLPAAWRAALTDPGEGFASIPGSFHDTPAGIPSIFREPPLLRDVSQSQKGEAHLGSPGSDCRIQGDLSHIWLTLAAPHGVTRDPGKEYAVFECRVAFPAGMAHPQADGVRIEAVNLQPCRDPESPHQDQLLLLDGDMERIYASCEPAHSRLIWGAEKPATRPRATKKAPAHRGPSRR